MKTLVLKIKTSGIEIKKFFDAHYYSSKILANKPTAPRKFGFGRIAPSTDRQLPILKKSVFV